jgi:phosphosulfolactate synthase (CoM biosynthesis protein A)
VPELRNRTAIEVSDGTVDMSHADENALILQARDQGFTVMSALISGIGREFLCCI